MDVDVLVVGAGPAGATAALNLAPMHRTLMIDRRSAPETRIGESLIPSTARLFADMGLLAEFERRQPRNHHGNESTWGSDAIEHRSFLRDPDGAGWHLDRASFEQFLVDAAHQRGAAVLRPTTMVDARPRRTGWDVVLAGPGGEQRLSSKCVVDAAGRAAPFARRAGARRVRETSMVSAWVVGAEAQRRPSLDAGAGVSSVAACADGWWYTAPITGGRRVLSVHTDPGTALFSRVRSPSALACAARMQPLIADRVAGLCVDDRSQSGTATASRGRLDRYTGHRWLAVGDAAFSFDPILSRGLFNAIYTGLCGAATLDRFLVDGTDLTEYEDEMNRIELSARRQTELLYSSEARFSDQPFWQRRRPNEPPR